MTIEQKMKNEIENEFDEDYLDKVKRTKKTIEIESERRKREYFERKLIN